MEKETKHIEFLREYAKCGIVHNYMHNQCDLDDRLKTMNEALTELSEMKKEREDAANLLIEIGKLCDIHDLGQFIPVGNIDRIVARIKK